MKYISIDGDDIGRKITLYYLSNNDKELNAFSQILEQTTKNIEKLLLKKGFTILFCAADGVVANIVEEIDFISIFMSIQELSPIGTSFSAGVGNDLREAYVALLAAKSNGKNCLYFYSELIGL